ncbi:MAG: DNA alkylation response protein, partial [Alphaproteobacteria bacterium]
AAAQALETDLRRRLALVPAPLAGALARALDRSMALLEATMTADVERQARQAATGLYYAAAAVLMAEEGCRIVAAGGDARRLLLARLALDHRLAPRDPLAGDDGAREAAIAAALLDDAPVAAERAAALAA